MNVRSGKVSARTPSPQSNARLMQADYSHAGKVYIRRTNRSRHIGHCFVPLSTTPAQSSHKATWPQSIDGTVGFSSRHIQHLVSLKRSEDHVREAAWRRARAKAMGVWAKTQTTGQTLLRTSGPMRSVALSFASITWRRCAVAVSRRSRSRATRMKSILSCSALSTAPAAAAAAAEAIQKRKNEAERTARNALQRALNVANKASFAPLAQHSCKIFFVNAFLLHESQAVISSFAALHGPMMSHDVS